MEQIGERILEIVEERFQGNKAAFARAIDGSHTSVNKYIKGEGYPDYKTLYNICTKLDVNCSWLLTGKEEGKTIINKTINNIENDNSGNQKTTNKDLSLHPDFKILKAENESLKREIKLQNELLDIYRKQSK